MPVKTGAKRHTHKYHKINGVWACALSDCTHYMPKNVALMIVGKSSICWACEQEFILTPNSLETNVPQCDDCSGKTAGINEYLAQKGL